MKLFNVVVSAIGCIVLIIGIVEIGEAKSITILKSADCETICGPERCQIPQPNMPCVEPADHPQCPGAAADCEHPCGGESCL